MTRSELLQKFFENRCNSLEAEEAMRYLQEEPWLMEKYLSAEDWKQSSDIVAMPKAESDQVYKNIQRVISPKPVLRKLMPAFGLAAVLSGLILGLVYLNSLNSLNPAQSSSSARAETSAEAHFYNSGGALELIKLPDNSTIGLYPGSSITYKKAFNSNRSITLQGRAEFDVRSNLSSPFVVTAGSVTTTALGTRFLVDNSGSDHQVNVKLYEGRVAVKPVDDDLMMAETFLEAGQECYVDLLARQVRVNSLYLVKAESKSVPVFGSEQPGIESSAFERLQFVKTPIPEVLEELKRVFNKEIDYQDSSFHGDFFTGEFSSEDSLSMILAVLSGMNDLKFTAEVGKISVEKSAPRLSLEKPTERIAAGSMADMAFRMNIKQIYAPVLPRSYRSAPLPVQEDQPIQYNFQSTGLPELFDQLQRQTLRKIIFNRQDLSNLFFTGKLIEGESVKNNLKLLCELNGLTLTIRRKSFEITRKS